MIDRAGFIGSSDAAAILGISPWKTPLQLYLEKVGEAPAEVEANAKAKTRGKRLEPYIIDMLRDELAIEPMNRNVVYVDRELPFLRAEVDFEYTLPQQHDLRRGEIKTVHPFKVKEWGDADTDEIPVHYTAQAMHGMMVDGRDETLFAVLIGDDLRIYRVQRDEQIIVALRQKEVDFWNNHVLARVPPAPTTVGDVLSLFSADLGTIAEADDATLAAIERLKELKPIVKEIEALEDRIKLFMGPAATLTRDGKVLATWKTQTTRRFDQKAFAEAHPDLFEQFKKASDSRVLRIK